MANKFDSTPMNTIIRNRTSSSFQFSSEIFDASNNAPLTGNDSLGLRIPKRSDSRFVVLECVN